MPWRCGFRVLCAFSVLVLLLRQTGAGKLARWCKRFQEFQEFRDRKTVSAKFLTSLFDKPFAVYLITSAQIEPVFRIGPEFYVGSTTVSVQKRQDSRLRKLRQLIDFKPVHAELMLHWQVSHHFLGSMIAIPLATMSTSRQIRTLESTLIQKWNPTLNYPFILKKRITKVGPDYSRSVRQIASSYSAPGNRLHRKLRARLHKMGALSLYSTEKQEVHSSWMILTVLAEKSLASFNLQRRLRSCSYSLPHNYALIRLSNNLEEPPKSLVQSILSRILDFKGGLAPPKARPIKIPLLSHDEFRNATKKWLTNKVVPAKDFLIPFHLPPRHVVSAAHSSMGTFLTNHHKMMAEFSWDTPPPCSCSIFREKHPNIGGVNHPEDGQWHVASPLDALHVSKRLRFLLRTSAKTQVYPALSSYIDETWAEVQRWAQRHFVPNVDYEDWRNFIRDQWSQHVVSSRTPLSFDDIKYIKSVLTGFVVQGRDHAPNHLHIFCPLLYWRILKSTFGDEEVYTRSLLTPNQAQDFLATMTRKPWLKPYRWGVQEAAKLPCSYLLLKQKKNFLEGSADYLIQVLRVWATFPSC